MGSRRRRAVVALGVLVLVASCMAGQAGRFAIAWGAEVPVDVLEAERLRVAVIDRASQAAVAIFAGEAGGGSGVLISPDGYALTNFHVVQPAGVAMKCGLADGLLYDAVLVGLDPTGDVALVKLVGRDDFPFAELADSDLVEVGDFCFAAGNPFLLATDFHPSISAGIVSGTRRYQFPAGTILEYADCLQVDAAINPGNSGGGLFDAEGRVIGVNGRASFEKRGRVNVGVGYAISSNQLRHFLGCLKGGRLADHATLGATVATAEDGRVVVSDILESSDAYRRGLRYDDEIVALAGRPVRTVNALKNVLGTLPAGWRVPLVYRRSGRRRDILVRLAGLHTSGELAKIVSGGQEADRSGEHDEPPPQGGRRTPQPGPQGRPGDPGQPSPEAAPPVLPEALVGLYEARNGYTNYHFNTVERDRVGRGLVARHTLPTGAGDWVLTGRLEQGGPFRIELGSQRATIDLPTGSSAIDATGELDATPAPPGSGGLLAALVLWRRLLIEGPTNVGRTTYWGTAPAWDAPAPAAVGDAGAPGTADGVPLLDILDTAVAAVEVRFTVGADGALSGVDLWPTPDSDPCEVRFTTGDGGAAGFPTRMEVRHGDEFFGTFLIEQIELGEGKGENGPPAASGPDAATPPGDQGGAT